ncbi:Arylsulfatase regulator [Cystobacter fuscus]|uniref:Arylsulfatase regulator n=2 Tax=Cystobacter fuscus TaxID=43 RepID=A0A250JLM3_9BACT|nr:Arylsulfatase regulator [Cystobacter fuscus]
MVKLEPFEVPSAPFLPAGLAPLRLTARELEGRGTLRTSSYTIYVDLPGNADEMLLVQAYTGAYDLASKRVATYLRSLEARQAPNPLYGTWTPEPVIEGEVSRPSDETIEALKKRGYLVTLTPEEEESLFARLSAKHHLATLRNAPNYVVMPTYECNLRCPYCFQDHMRTDARNSHLLRVMDRSMVDRILAGMSTIEAAHGLKADADLTRTLTFFGGEPLLARSRPIIQYFMERMRARGRVRLNAITNATELDAYADLLGAEGIASIQVTLDGIPEEHDRRRIYPDGSGSFARIARNITLALERGVAVSVRMNIDRGNIEQLPALAEVFEAHGWSREARFSPYVAPIHEGNASVDAKSTFTSWQLTQAMEELRQRHPAVSAIGLMDDSLQFKARQIFDQKAQSTGFSTAFCGAHTTMYVFDAFGDIYACWERTGDTRQRIGHVTPAGEVLMSRLHLHAWRGRNVVSNPVCRKCRYATSCGGGCAVMAEGATGTLYKNFCDGYAQRFRAKVAQAYQEHVSGSGPGLDVSRLCET